MFHVPSFLLGYVSGAGTVLLARHFSPALSELVTAAYGLVDSASAAVAARFEDLEDLLAEARARATAERGARPAPARAKVLRAVPRTASKTATRRRGGKRAASSRRK
jgi:hypothetical protein